MWNAALGHHVAVYSFRVDLPASGFALGSTKWLTGAVGCSKSSLAATILFLLLDIVVVSSIAIEVFPICVAARLLILAFILHVSSETLALDLHVLLRHPCVSELRVCLLWMGDVSGDGLGRLFAQVELAVRVKVVVAIDSDRTTTVRLLVGLLVTRPLAIGTLFLDDELLSAICINCIYLLQLAGWLHARLLELLRIHLLHCLLLLFVLFKAFL